MRKQARALCPILLTLSCATAFAQTAEQVEFFEKKIRPILVNRCQACHNPKLRTASLDLTTAAGFLAGGQSGPLISRENVESSRILKVISYEERLKMPPTGKLKPEEIDEINEWVKMGAPWPGADRATAKPAPRPATDFTPEQKQFWAFQPVQDAAPPPVRDKKWPRTPIDRFILAKLEEKGLRPAPPAGKFTLLRRATYDLTGLPPTEQEIREFQADQSPDAFRKVVDRLLASPRYGERWGRHWLDVARYADSTGNDEDHRYPYAWRYRDYVIDAFNNDLPYDQFVREQIAGDLLPGSDPDRINRRGIVATGFLALGPKALAQKDKTKMLYDVYDEQVDVVSKAFLGLTVSCARCHNHKFDPILSKDYYSLVSIFASTKDFAGLGETVSRLLYVPLVPQEIYARYRAEQDRILELKLAIDDIADREAEKYAREAGSRIAAYMLAARKVEEGEELKEAARHSNLDGAVLARWVAYLKAAAGRPELGEWQKAQPGELPEAAQRYQVRFLARLEEWNKTLNQWRENAHKRLRAMDMPPPPRPKFDAAKDRFFNDVYLDKGPFALPQKESEALFSPEAREKLAALRRELDEQQASAMPEPDMACAVAEGDSVEQKVFLRGDYNNPGEDAPKGFPRILAKPGDPVIRRGSGRLELAEWITRADHPLTPRVMVNRIWQWHFGEGLVRTPDNFGKMGDRPVYPELLDYLARQFVRSGWSVKAMHRMIMLSSAYQMSSDGDKKSLEVDPENRLLARFNRQRLDVEEIRDGLLAAGGELDLAMGGTLQKGFGTDTENSEQRLSLDPAKVRRRTVYLPLRRANLPTLLNLFDFGDATTETGQRPLTNIAPQALFMMNSEFVYERSRHLAGILLAGKGSDAERVRSAYVRIWNREPKADEIDVGLSYIRRFADRFAGPSAVLDAWQSFCHVLMNANEFVYLD
jgi:hypothetical protein